MGFNDRVSGKTDRDLQTRIKQSKELRDLLGGQLQGLENKTQFISDWVETHKQDIVQLFKDLNDAFNAKDKTTVEALIESQKEIAPVVLSIPSYVGNVGAEKSFAELALKKFDDEALSKKISTIEEGLVEHLSSFFEDGLDALDEKSSRKPASQEEAEKMISEVEETLANEGDVEKKASLWNRLSGKSQDGLEVELRKADAEYVALTTQTPYYIDSFFDWVEDATLPEQYKEHSQSKKPDNKHLQSTYKRPEYAIARATEDFQESTKNSIAQLQDLAHMYTEFCQSIEAGKGIDLDALFPEEPTKTFEIFTQYALAEYDAVSFEDVIFKHVKDKKYQAGVLRLAPHGNVQFSDAKSSEDIFNKVFKAVLDEKDPLSMESLKVAMEKMEYRPSDNKETRSVRAIINRFGNDFEGMKDALETLYAYGETDVTNKTISGYVSLLQAIEEKDVNAYIRVLKRYDVSTVVGFAKNVERDFSIGDFALDLFDTNSKKSAALKAAIETDYIPQTLQDHGQLLSFVVENVGQDKDPMEMSLLETAVSYVSERVDETVLAGTMNYKMGFQDGALEFITQNCEQKSTEMLAILLEPFSSDVIRASVLKGSADLAKDKTTKKNLMELSQAVGGAYLNYGQGVMNADKMSDIWCDDNKIYYMTDGVGYKSHTGFNSNEMSECLGHFARQSGMETAGSELLKPEMLNHIWGEYDRAGDVVLQYFASGGQSYSGALNEDDVSKVFDKLSNDNNYANFNDVWVNIPKTPYMFFQDESLYALVGQEKDGSLILRALNNDLEEAVSEQDAQDLLAQKSKNKTAITIGDHVLDTKDMSMVWYDDKAEKVCFMYKGTFYMPNEKEPSYGISATKAQSKKVLERISAQEHMTSVGKYHLNIDNLSTIDFESEQIFISDSKGECSLGCSTDVKDAFKETVSQHKDMIFVKDKALNLSKVTNIWQDEEGCLNVLTPTEKVTLGKMSRAICKDVFETCQAKGFISLPNSDDMINMNNVMDVFCEENDGMVSQVNLTSSCGIVPVYLNKPTPVSDVTDCLADHGLKNSNPDLFKKYEKTLQAFRAQRTKTGEQGTELTSGFNNQTTQDNVAPENKSKRAQGMHRHKNGSVDYWS